MLFIRHATFKFKQYQGWPALGPHLTNQFTPLPCSLLKNFKINIDLFISKISDHIQWIRNNHGLLYQWRSFVIGLEASSWYDFCGFRTYPNFPDRHLKCVLHFCFLICFFWRSHPGVTPCPAPLLQTIQATCSISGQTVNCIYSELHYYTNLISNSFIVRTRYHID